MRLIVFIIFFCLVATSCEREIGNYCHEMGRWSGNIPIQQIGEKLTNDTVDCWLVVIDTSPYWEPTFYQIDDQQTFEDLVNCNCEIPNFNFKDYTLLIGYYFSTYRSIKTEKQELVIKCEHFEQFLYYRVYVEVDKNVRERTYVQFHAVVPKLPKGFSPNLHIYRVNLEPLPAPGY